MSNIIDSIKLSGVTYDLVGSGGGGNPTVEVTQAEYDAMVTAGTVSADTYYIITDAQAGDLTNYYTKSETNTLLGGKADTATTYTKTEVDNAITAATSTKQDQLVSSVNIKTINNESILGSGNITIQGGGISSAQCQTLIDQSISGKTNQSDFTGHTASTVHMTTTEKTNLDSLATNIAAISGITSTKVGNWDTASTNSHTHSNKTVLDGINSTKVSNWDGAATNASNAITALGGLKLVKLSQSAYDSLQTKDNNTLYVIVG